ncbi:MAG: stage IV sporulation protein A [Clostridia bacterium]|nr:stage IV sporulation protein A [Clostridia bacterium]
MDEYNLYQNIAKRTGSDIYIGVVGPVRTGKSTFIKRFMETLVIPNIENKFRRERAYDELPQSASGRTIMTTEPKFIPEEAVEVTLSGNASFNVRMIDCVGYVVDGALGQDEDGRERMVETPWSPEPVSFTAAAETGTKKVITEHSTIGLMITTDGSFTDIPRASYEEAERRVISELLAINKPFVILVNSAHPKDAEAVNLANALSGEYGVPALCVNCMELGEDDIKRIIEKILFEFPIKELAFFLPDWLSALPEGHWLWQTLFESVREALGSIKKINAAQSIVEKIASGEKIKEGELKKIDLGCGRVDVRLSLDKSLYYRILSDETGLSIGSDAELIGMMKELSAAKKEYDKIACAISEVKNTGYGIVHPTVEEMTLEEPSIVKQGGRYGVKLCASAPSIHMIRADIKTEVSPIVGSEKQSEDLVNYLLSEFEVDPAKIWDSNIFGKSLHELVNEGLNNKLYKMPAPARLKLQETLERIINDGSNGLICIIL